MTNLTVSGAAPHDDGVEATAFLDAHPEIRTALPGWVTKIIIDLDGEERREGVGLILNGQFGGVEFDMNGIWKDGHTTLLPEEGYGITFPYTDYSSFTCGELITYARQHAADLLRGAQALEEANA